MTPRLHITVRISYEVDRMLRLAEEALRVSRSEVLRQALDLGARELVRRAWSTMPPRPGG